MTRQCKTFCVLSENYVWLRRRHPALRSDGFALRHHPDQSRVFSFERWIEGIGRNVVVVASLNESTQYNYQIGFPLHGEWIESFNSDIYDHWVNPNAAGNGGRVTADQGPWDGLQASARITVPANSILVFTVTLETRSSWSGENSCGCVVCRGSTRPSRDLRFARYPTLCRTRYRVFHRTTKRASDRRSFDSQSHQSLP